MEISGSRFSAPSTATSKSVTDALHPFIITSLVISFWQEIFQSILLSKDWVAKNIPEVFALAYWECIY